jgi:UDP-N-acetylmuramate dehydrogenase
MNAGGHGSDIAATLRCCRIVDVGVGGRGVARDWRPPELDYRYRHSSVRPHHVVTRAEFALRPGEPAAGREKIREIVKWRRQHQPGGQNAGSVFTNPEHTSAGWLVEASGLKGYRLGTAQVSPKHANFIQADPGGLADDVYRLMRYVRERVADQQHANLASEVRLIGFPPEDESPSQLSTLTGG